MEYAISRRGLLRASLGGALVAGSIARSWGQAPLSLKVGFSPINEYTGLFIAKDKGFFEKRGLDVTPMLIQNNATIPPALFGNSIQVGTPSVSTTMQAVDGGIALQFICGAGVLSAKKPSIALVAKVGSPFKQPADLKGKRIGVSALNALFHVIAREWLIKGGVDPKSVTFVETPFTQMFDTLRGGQVDALVASEPILGRIVKAGVGETVGNILDAVMDNALSGNYATTVDFAKANRNAMSDFRAAIEESHAFIAENPEAAFPSVARYLHLSEDIVRTIPPPILRSEIDRSQVQFWVDVMKRQGMLRRDPSIDSLMGELA